MPTGKATNYIMRTTYLDELIKETRQIASLSDEQRELAYGSKGWRLVITALCDRLEFAEL